MSKPKTEFTPDDIKQVETMAGLGLNLSQIAAILGLCKETIRRRSNELPELKEAIEKGRAKAIAQVSKTAYEMAIKGDVPAMTMFYLKCRAGWKETMILEHTGEDGGPIVYKTEWGNGKPTDGDA